ncbi:MAG TPA: hypothetical protein VKV28_14115 [Candidatus Binataceae bacterium]|nr:hypothetical protein [Candidatus Binataceae bacterium]
MAAAASGDASDDELGRESEARIEARPDRLRAELKGQIYRLQIRMMVLIGAGFAATIAILGAISPAKLIYQGIRRSQIRRSQWMRPASWTKKRAVAARQLFCASAIAGVALWHVVSPGGPRADPRRGACDGGAEENS